MTILITFSLLFLFAANPITSFFSDQLNFIAQLNQGRSTKLSLGKSPEDIFPEKENRERYITLPRLYVGQLPIGEISESPIRLTKGLSIKLDPEQSHYVTKVMRIDGKRRSQLRLFDGISGEWLGKVEILGGNKRRNEVFVQCIEQLRSLSKEIEEEEILPWIIFAPLKKARTKMLLEKCTELGSGQFIWIKTDRTDLSSLRDCQDGERKLSLQIVEASEQSERLKLPSISNHIGGKSEGEGNPLTVDKLLNLWQDEELSKRSLLICRERSIESSPVLTTLGNDTSKVAFLVGPEGGWSPEEESIFKCAEAKSNGRIRSISLGSSVLRAETAAIAALAAYSAHIDGFRADI